MLALHHAFLSGTSRLTFDHFARARPALACRRRALETRKESCHRLRAPSSPFDGSWVSYPLLRLVRATRRPCPYFKVEGLGKLLKASI